MAGLVSNLIGVLKEQVELYRQISALLARKKELVIKNEIDELREVVGQENILVPKNLRIDKTRDKIMKDICMVLNKNEEEMTLTYLVTLMEGQPEHEELKDVVEQMAKAATELKELNDATKVLIQHALDFLEYNINVLHSSFAEAPAGYNDTLEENREQRSFLDING